MNIKTIIFWALLSLVQCGDSRGPKIFPASNGIQLGWYDEDNWAKMVPGKMGKTLLQLKSNLFANSLNNRNQRLQSFDRVLEYGTIIHFFIHNRTSECIELAMICMTDRINQQNPQDLEWEIQANLDALSAMHTLSNTSAIEEINTDISFLIKDTEQSKYNGYKFNMFDQNIVAYVSVRKDRDPKTVHIPRTLDARNPQNIRMQNLPTLNEVHVQIINTLMGEMNPLILSLPGREPSHDPSFIENPHQPKTGSVQPPHSSPMQSEETRFQWDSSFTWTKFVWDVNQKSFIERKVQNYNYKPYTENRYAKVVHLCIRDYSFEEMVLIPFAIFRAYPFAEDAQTPKYQLNIQPDHFYDYAAFIRGRKEDCFMEALEYCHSCKQAEKSVICNEYNGYRLGPICLFDAAEVFAYVSLAPNSPFNDVYTEIKINDLDFLRTEGNNFLIEYVETMLRQTDIFMKDGDISQAPKVHGSGEQSPPSPNPLHVPASSGRQQHHPVTQSPAPPASPNPAPNVSAKSGQPNTSPKQGNSFCIFFVIGVCIVGLIAIRLIVGIMLSSFRKKEVVVGSPDKLRK